MVDAVQSDILSLVYFQKFLINFEILLENYIEKSEMQYVVKIQQELEQEMRNVALRILVLNRNLFLRKDTETEIE